VKAEREHLAALAPPVLRCAFREHAIEYAMPTKVAQPSHSVETSVQTRLYLPHERARRWAAGKCEASDSGTEPKKPAHAREATDHVRRSECVCCACGTDQTLGINFVREDHPLRDALQVNRRRLSMNTVGEYPHCTNTKLLMRTHDWRGESGFAPAAER
jgi:hypothetical protein